MNLRISSPQPVKNAALNISGSKSETNRLLLLQALFPELAIKNTSNSDDSEAMMRALTIQNGLADIHHAGTAMRFLAAYFAIQENREIILTGSQRMQERPIEILVEALQQLGADISYVKNAGFPPIKIKGKKLVQNQVTLNANVSSQYISALLLIAPKLENGLELTLEGKITSVPYINMTLALLDEIGVNTSFIGNVIKVSSKSEIKNPTNVTVESDWSSASYFYSIVALSPIGTQIKLSSYKENSLQGDSHLSEIYETMGVKTVFENNQIIITKNDRETPVIAFDLNKTPDIAQTIAATCFGLGISCRLTGLHTLKIKETDRLEALKTELEKLGATIAVTNDSLILEKSTFINPEIKIATYNDHRMAMAFAPLAIKKPILIEDAGVVSKSYPDFWSDLKTLGFLIEETN
ncbi:3-phosphoshikimate 1-carboxyvinyltransferase [Flavobacterium noncentrifugens]|uniref:3-phosphoshikimate 1-carboxyvinyltransferase n=1 Tax=Flavobacterium noncentrifugens TaxID=1128970 RepID=A0A1G9B4C0_9FLAO|nr:3-phosphoshikimate 1-carboxyvinyltransferase [Flavobacterium noncentrifugens]GEP51689.1 3-phosphoshikimate 1-carboxyvinyltransferase [Flavobacterium noncentrifugens]SDK33954.1 3-phosphoshikimate 1-carboxyvinyltransferase [Flavobacterium noncentrifugens]